MGFWQQDREDNLEDFLEDAHEGRFGDRYATVAEYAPRFSIMPPVLGTQDEIVALNPAIGMNDGVNQLTLDVFDACRKIYGRNVQVFALAANTVVFRTAMQGKNEIYCVMKNAPGARITVKEVAQEKKQHGQGTYHLLLRKDNDKPFLVETAQSKNLQLRLDALSVEG